ncbi:MAG: hypothetical protein L0K86_00290 [Actinomycetia bacterium]|nr:hypothetical protein [Actinomycetes bacterium]
MTTTTDPEIDTSVDVDGTANNHDAGRDHGGGAPVLLVHGSGPGLGPRERGPTAYARSPFVVMAMLVMMSVGSAVARRAAGWPGAHEGSARWSHPPATNIRAPLRTIRTPSAPSKAIAR